MVHDVGGCDLLVSVSVHRVQDRRQYARLRLAELGEKTVCNIPCRKSVSSTAVGECLAESFGDDEPTVDLPRLWRAE